MVFPTPFSSEISFKDGDDYATSSGVLTDRIIVDLDRRINFLAMIGMQCQIRSNLLLDMEIKQFLRRNILTRNHYHYDAGDSFDYYRPFPRILSIRVDLLYLIMGLCQVGLRSLFLPNRNRAGIQKRKPIQIGELGSLRNYQ